MCEPLVSVVMPVYNGQAVVVDAIESILAQTYTTLELIVIDDGSTDQTWTMINLAREQDQRIKCIRQSRAGLTASLNRAIRYAEGSIIARQDADDWSIPIRLERQIRWIQQHGFDFVCSRAFLKTRERPTPGYIYFVPRWTTVYFVNPYIHGTYFLTREILARVGGYDEAYPYAQDYKLIYDLLNVQCKIKYLKEPLYRLSKNIDSISAKHGNAQRFYAKKVRRLFWGLNTDISNHNA